MRYQRGMGKLWRYVVGVLLLSSMSALAQEDDTVCAVVKIEIKQELTLERQAFDAEMRITNGLDDIPLNDVNVDVYFEDEDGLPVLATSDSNNTSASFYIRIASLENLDAVDGSGVVAAGTTAVANWLIIPAPGSAKDVTGSVYYVGATLTYTINGEEEEVIVAPDLIVVKPLPRLTLDYFLEEEVIADDAFTLEIEPAVPFTLGVRISNNGEATASDVKIDSAQPEIVENDQGLAIGFEIIGSFVSDEAVNDSLLIDFGDIPANEARMGRWQMETTLSGKFTEFTADFTHADDLGGALTSLLEATNTHLLIKDVLVDLAGRDTILDFLADDGDEIRIYESNTIDTVVDDQSDLGAISFVQNTGVYQQYTITLPSQAGFVFARIPDSYSFNGSKDVYEVFRSDGKRIPLSNVWFSQSRNESQGFDYFINIFDVDSTGEYTVLLEDKINVAQAPVLQFIPDRRMVEGQSLSFLVEASDPNGTVPTISMEALPEGATLVLNNTDNNMATYVFSWTPASGQARRYELNFIATDGELSSNRRAYLDVYSRKDTDNDGMDDDWEIEHFGNLDRDGTGDYDGDGVSDLDEFLSGSNPKSVVPSGAMVPIIESPFFGDDVDTLTPVLTIINSEATTQLALQYVFEVYRDTQMTDLVFTQTVNEDIGLTTSLAISETLDENATYSWRVRAYDGSLYSEWVIGKFTVNSVAEAPGAFKVSKPSDGAEVTSLTPTLIVDNSRDPDGDALSYVFEVFEDSSMTSAYVTSPSLAAGLMGSSQWLLSKALEEDGTYYWRVTASDASGLYTQTAASVFYVNTTNTPPSDPVIDSPLDGAVTDSADVILQLDVAGSFDPDTSDLLYEFELDTINTFDSDSVQRSGITSSLRFAVSELNENMTYYWRARASDGFAQSDWVLASFRVNGVNEIPPLPSLANPGDGAWVATLLPTLSLNAVEDPDGDVVTYHFELYADTPMVQLLDSHESEDTAWAMDMSLSDNTWYYWRARAADDKGMLSEWSELSGFFINDNNVDDAPTFEFLSPSVAGDASEDGLFVIRWSDTDPDSSASIALFYDTDDDGLGGNLIVDGLSEDEDGDVDTYSWDTSNLDSGEYYLYAEISDDTSLITVVSAAVVVPEVAVNNPPSITITAPSGDLSMASGEPVLITWHDSDDDSRALISLYYDTDGSGEDGILIVENIEEDDTANEYEWMTTGLGLDDFYVYAVIDDGVNTPVVVYAEAVISLTQEFIIGTDEDDTINGATSAVKIDGGAGDDLILGSEFDDILIGGDGDDRLGGGLGDDTYVIGLNEGNDYILNYEAIGEISNDRIVFIDGILLADIDMTTDGKDLVITIPSTGQIITVGNNYWNRETSTYELAAIEFSDGTALDFNAIRERLLTTTDGDDIVYGFFDRSNVIDGGLGNDEIYGHDEVDTLYGGEGNDILDGGGRRDFISGEEGNDELIGGAGDDYLFGGLGDDNYIIGLGDGSDNIYNDDDTAVMSNDRIVFTDGILLEDVELSTDGMHLYITIPSTEQVIRSYNNFANRDDYNYELAGIEFSDGTEWDFIAIREHLLTSTDGDDIVYGFSDSKNNIDGGLGNDEIYGHDETDTLNGNQGDDILYGGRGNDFIGGSDGDDELIGGFGDDTLFGGLGNDTYIIGLDDDDDFIYNYEVSDIASDDRILFIDGIVLSDIAFSVDGANLLVSVTSTGQVVTVYNHFVSSDDSFTALSAVEFSDGTVVDADDIRTILTTTTDGDDIAYGFYNSDDLILGGAGDDELYGDAGDDSLIGESGNDRLIGGSGDDILFGGLGNDTYIIGLDDDDDVIYNYEASDIASDDRILFIDGIVLSDIAFSVDGANLLVSVTSTGQVVTVYRHFAPSDDSFTELSAVEFSDGTVVDADDIRTILTTTTDGDDIAYGFYNSDDLILGGAGDDELYGDAGDDSLIGESGNDRLIGGSGDDILFGGLGNDTYIIGLDDDDDVIYNYEASDIASDDRILFIDGIVLSDIAFSVDGANLLVSVTSTGQVVTVYNHFVPSDDSFTALSAVEFSDGTVVDADDIITILTTTTDGDDIAYGFYNSDDLLDGGAGDDELHGDAGDDSLIGGLGNDWLIGGLGNDDLTGDEGDDILEGGDGDDTLEGDDGYDTLEGGAGNDTLRGHDGDDILVGGTGDDFLWGYNGANTYVIEANDGNDVIYVYDLEASSFQGDHTLLFGEGITADDIGVAVSDYNLVITVNSTGQTINIALFFYNWGDEYYFWRLGYIEFADGTIWDTAEMATRAGY